MAKPCDPDTEREEREDPRQKRLGIETRQLTNRKHVHPADVLSDSFLQTNSMEPDLSVS